MATDAWKKSKRPLPMLPASLSDRLPDQLVERVLASLGVNRREEPALDFLRQLYRAWCHRVPFDNVLKLIHVLSLIHI